MLNVEDVVFDEMLHSRPLPSSAVSFNWILIQLVKLQFPSPSLFPASSLSKTSPFSFSPKSPIRRVRVSPKSLNPFKCHCMSESHQRQMLIFGENLLQKSKAIKRKIQALEHETKESLDELEQREVTINQSVEIVLVKVEETKKAALKVLKRAWSDDEYGEVDNNEGLLMEMKSLCLKMESGRFWRFVIGRKKELESLRSLALAECVDPARFVMEAISEVFPVDKRSETNPYGQPTRGACHHGVDP